MKALSDLPGINEKFKQIEQQLKNFTDSISNKISNKELNIALVELNKKISSKVSVKAWENTLSDLDKQYKDLVLTDLKEVDERLDRTVELMNRLTALLNEKVNVSAWNRLCASNDQLINQINLLRNKYEEVIKKVLELESFIKSTRVSEDELKNLLRSI